MMKLKCLSVKTLTILYKLPHKLLKKLSGMFCHKYLVQTLTVNFEFLHVK